MVACPVDLKVSKISNHPCPVPALTVFFSRVRGFPVTMLLTLVSGFHRYTMYLMSQEYNWMAGHTIKMGTGSTRGGGDHGSITPPPQFAEKENRKRQSISSAPPHRYLDLHPPMIAIHCSTFILLAICRSVHSHVYYQHVFSKTFTEN